MKVIQGALPGLLILEPQVFGDNRGWFYESYNARGFAEAAGIDAAFVQDNHSRSAGGVLRGLHYQVGAAAQGKLVRVTSGEIYDVVVDIRRSSPTFGRWSATVLSAGNRLMLWVPPGFAHGFLTTSGEAEVQYKATAYWAPRYERCIAWNDPELAIEWPLEGEPNMSAKDRAGLPLRDSELFP